MNPHDRTRSSMRDLIAEADRREIAGAEWMDRDALVAALEDGQGSAGPLGALARARRFLGHVTGLGRVAKVVREAIDPARPSAPTLVTGQTQASAEPIMPTTSIAPTDEVTELAHDAAPMIPAAEVAAPAATIATLPVPAASELLAGDPSFGGMRVVSRNGRAWLVWRAPGARLAAIAGHASAPAELTLRMVSIDCAIGEPNAEVVIDTADETGLALEGVRALPEARGRRCVAAIGLGRGERFVAVAHARVA